MEPSLLAGKLHVYVELFIILKFYETYNYKIILCYKIYQKRNITNVKYDTF